MKKLPKSRTLINGPHEEVYETIDDFFTETKNFIASKYSICGPYFQIKSGELAFQPNVVSCDMVTYLLYKQRVVACVLATRTDFNNVQYDFFRNLNDLDGD